jgi:hypothetical protein
MRSLRTMQCRELPGAGINTQAIIGIWHPMGLAIVPTGLHDGSFTTSFGTATAEIGTLRKTKGRATMVTVQNITTTIINISNQRLKTGANTTMLKQTATIPQDR